MFAALGVFFPIGWVLVGRALWNWWIAVGSYVGAGIVAWTGVWMVFLFRNWPSVPSFDLYRLLFVLPAWPYLVLTQLGAFRDGTTLVFN